MSEAFSGYRWRVIPFKSLATESTPSEQCFTWVEELWNNGRVVTDTRHQMNEARFRELHDAVVNALKDV